MILSWQEHMPLEEQPPEWMWHVDTELVAWFEEVKRRREERYGTKSHDDDSGPMMQNELAEQMRRR